jgi:uridine phosphorylase
MGRKPEGDKVMHLGLDTGMTKGARYALLPGDPYRSETLARAVADNGSASKLAWKREYCSWLAEVEGVPVLVTSTGIGGPSASIAIDELAQLGVTSFIRVGTTGAIQPHIPVGDVIITSGSVRLDGASTHYAPVEFPAVAHHEVMAALVAGAKQVLPGRFHVGVTVSCDTFYPGQERKDSFSGYVPRRFQNITEEWKRLHCLNYEMESATVLTLGAALGLRAGSVAGVVVNREQGEQFAALEEGEDNSVRLAAAGLRELVRQDRAGSRDA